MDTVLKVINLKHLNLAIKLLLMVLIFSSCRVSKNIDREYFYRVINKEIDRVSSNVVNKKNVSLKFSLDDYLLEFISEYSDVNNPYVYSLKEKIREESYYHIFNSVYIDFYKNQIKYRKNDYSKIILPKNFKIYVDKKSVSSYNKESYNVLLSVPLFDKSGNYSLIAFSKGSVGGINIYKKQNNDWFFLSQLIIG